ncbi:hypothetical protein GOA89_14905 [Sinorhizobium meliloti]|nr:hypothetical protein [Sinorhizobium meliloti]MDW9847586.1 hypothetical protein [Sinorhizobium meliloti]MDX0144031.1 hypothetical protein [Sinorhizobium meliloti]MDX0150456.1 hypothetical protein [Sinorhizobium meliloti]MDX0169764.1 hypothetical protein [Sinorhizobium meliloti]
MVSPSELWVDESYQRGLSDRSMRLIRKIVGEWDWTAFKPPVVVEVEGRLQVIDGQHTAIGAVTHGGIEQLPVLVVTAERQEMRAQAFVRHNRDRIQVTPTQLHTALVAAGDEDALTIAQVCARAGVTILKNAPPFARFKPGETMAISTVAALVNRRHAAGARRVLETCVKGGAAPVSAAMIRAVEHLLFAKEYAGEIDSERIALLISSRLSTLEQEAQRFATERKMPLWRALASVIYMNRRKAR